MTPAVLEQQLGAPVTPVPWLPGFYALDDAVRIAGCDAYRTAQIQGVDAASGAAITVLDPQPGDHVLDLCCAPGTRHRVTRGRGRSEALTPFPRGGAVLSVWQERSWR